MLLEAIRLHLLSRFQENSAGDYAAFIPYRLIIVPQRSISFFKRIVVAAE